MFKPLADNGRSADVIDQAAAATEAFTEAALEGSRRSLLPQSHPDFDGAHCVACGDEMPFARLAAKRIRCTPCETKRERGL